MHMCVCEYTLAPIELVTSTPETTPVVATKSRSLPIKVGCLDSFLTSPNNAATVQGVRDVYVCRRTGVPMPAARRLYASSTSNVSTCRHVCFRVMSHHHRKRLASKHGDGLDVRRGGHAQHSGRSPCRLGTNGDKRCIPHLRGC